MLISVLYSREDSLCSFLLGAEWTPSAIMWLEGLGQLKKSLDIIENRKLGLKVCSIVPQPSTKLHGLSPRANYTDRATAACRRSNYQLLWIEGATWSA
jgi:hypothetical protein